MKKRSFRSTFVSVILVITVAISIVNLAVYGINIKKIRQVEVLKMKTAGERIDDMITISLNNIKGLKQICCTDNYARNILLKNNEKNDIGTKFENQNYMDNALKHIASMDTLILRANQVIHSILEDIIIKEESAQKLYMAVVEILKILGNYYAELYQDEDIEELKDIKVMFSRRYDLYKFKHIEELENYLKEMVIVICSGKENTKKKSKIVEEIVHYVENNYYKNISLRELAENKYFVNYSYCSRLFSQETGMNFSKYLIQYRLKKAKTLLENKDMKISFIAFEVGYNDVSHFIQSFKKSYGLTPEEYRARKKIE